jgi:hypothetical protein
VGGGAVKQGFAEFAARGRRRRQPPGRARGRMSSSLFRERGLGFSLFRRVVAHESKVLLRSPSKASVAPHGCPDPWQRDPAAHARNCEGEDAP